MLHEMYLDYVNNFITVECFADFYDITSDVAERVIRLGRMIHERQVA